MSKRSFLSCCSKLVGARVRVRVMVRVNLMVRVRVNQVRPNQVRALQAEGEWVRALDEMRLQDLATIQQLEARLAQWSVFHN